MTATGASRPQYRIPKRVGDDAGDLTVHAGEPRDEGAAEGGLDLEEAVAVDEVADQLLHVVGLTPILWHDRAQRLIATIDQIGAMDHGRQFPDIGRHVGEEAADLLEADLLVGHAVFVD